MQLQIHGMLANRTEDEVIVRLWGEYPEGQFFADLHFEIDGRDFEVEPLWGPNPLDLDFDLCDTLYSHPRWPEIEALMLAA